MCKVLKISRSTYYYEAKEKLDESELVLNIVDIFKVSRNNYGTRKIKSDLSDRNIMVSRRRIGKIMKQEGLVSRYTTVQFYPQKDTFYESKIENVVDCQFSKQPFRNVVVSELTYVRVDMNGTTYAYLLIALTEKLLDLVIE